MWSSFRGSLYSYLDRDQRYLYVDSSYASWYGFAKEEVVGKLIEEILPPANYEKVRPNLEWMIENGRELHYQHTITRYDGEVRTVAISYIPHLDHTGRVKAFFATVLDISEQVKTSIALKESEEKYRSLVDNSLVGIYIIRDGVLLFCNQGLADMFGYERAEDMYGTLVQERIAPKDWAFVQEEMRRKEAGENLVSQYGFEALRLDGSTFNAQIRSQAIKYEGKPAIQGILIDITSQLEAEERFRSLSEASQEAIFISEKGVCLEQNLAAEKLFGYSLKEAVGRLGTDWIAEEDRDTVMHHMLSGYEEPYMVYALRKDGSTFPCEITGRMMEYRGRKVRVTVLRDITKQRNAEEYLRESEEKYRNIVENAIEGMFRSTFDGRFLMANPALAEIYGYDSPEELITEVKDIREELYIDGEVRDELINSLKAGKELIDIVEENRRKDGSRIWISTKAHIVQDDDGAPLYIEGFVEDITEKFSARTTLEKYTRQLEIVNKITAALSTSLTLEDVLEIILQQVVQVVECDSAAIFLTDEHDQLTIVKAVGEATQFDGYTVSLNQSLMQGIEKDQRSLILDDAMLSPNFRSWEGSPVIRGWMGLSLYARDILVGYLTFDSCEPRTFTPQHAALAESFAPHIAQAIHNARLHQEIQDSLQQLKTLNTVIGALSTSLDLNHLLETFFEQINEVLPFGSGAIFLLEGDQLRIMLDKGLDPSLQGETFPVENDLFQEMLSTNQPIILENPHEDARYKNWAGFTDLKSWLGAPLIARNELIGFLTLDNYQDGFVYSSEQADLARSFAAQVAQAIYNARLYERVIRDANDLEKHVQQRTEELQKFVELTADREIRMVELKEAIRKLRTQLIEAGQIPVADDPLSIS